MSAKELKQHNIHHMSYKYIYIYNIYLCANMDPGTASKESACDSCGSVQEGLLADKFFGKHCIFENVPCAD